MRRFRLLAVLALLLFASNGATIGRSAHVATTRLTVTGGEYYFKLSKTKVPRGVVYVTLVNAGTESHDLQFTGKKPMTKVLNPGAKQTIKLVFSRRGRYAFLCTVGEHALKGMHGTLVVR